MRTTCLLIGILIFASGAAIAQTPTINLRLPSDAATGGTLAIRLTIPPQTTDSRYSDSVSGISWLRLCVADQDATLPMLLRDP